MAAIWPPTLPQRAEAGSEVQTSNQSIRSSMETGPAKVRRRFTASVIPCSIALTLTTAQVVIMNAFHDVELEGGSLTFAWDPFGDAYPAVWRFVEPPICRIIQGAPGRWSVVLKLEAMP